MAFLLAASPASLQADPAAQVKTDEAKPIVYPTGYLRTEDWLKASTAPLAKGELDRLVNEQLKKANVGPAPLTTDEQFVRRVWLDLTGRLPKPTDLKEFLADQSPDKRARLVDKLLATDDFARHWALYWRDVIMSKITDQRTLLFAGHFENWMTDQLKANRKWSDITRELLTATGEMRNDDPTTNGQAFFLASRRGADATTEIAAETSRIFLGIQIQCAQCHDHPSDIWKRKQFHEFAAYFARYREFPVRDGMKLVGAELKSLPFGEHRMPDKNDPKKGMPVSPRFFVDGKAPKSVGFKGLGDLERRKALAEAIVAKSNPWFAGAFVNRIWGELMGQAFYTPIDDLGPEKEAMMPEVLARVAGAFRGSDYDIKGLFRELATSDTYQRQIRPGESPDQHLLFAAHAMTRMNANALWMALVDTLGNFGGPADKGFGGPFARFLTFEFRFKQEFGFDPSTKAEDIEGSVSQALLLMNNPQINQRIQAKGMNLLGRILAAYTNDDEAIRMVYLRVLARRPTDRELARCRQHIRSVGNRAEAFEDILWVLINSTEFQTRR
ncbi:MAG: DUF1549 and DUF1553 domain-containing protein [Gemmataceae bacterium]|nr:DUF1549 and DUF1553 domain-containing protein [Gemmataceae bacterium]